MILIWIKDHCELIFISALFARVISSLTTGASLGLGRTPTIPTPTQASRETTTPSMCVRSGCASWTRVMFGKSRCSVFLPWLMKVRGAALCSCHVQKPQRVCKNTSLWVILLVYRVCAVLVEAFSTEIEIYGSLNSVRPSWEILLFCTVIEWLLFFHPSKVWQVWNICRCQFEGYTTFVPRYERLQKYVKPLKG